MKIAFIRYPEDVYQTGQAVRGGSEVTNQIIIDGLSALDAEVTEFAPKTRARLALQPVPAVGTPLMFQDLLRYLDEINRQDVVITTNWFGAILPEIKPPLATIFHTDALMVAEAAAQAEPIQPWLEKAQALGITPDISTSLFEQVGGFIDGYGLSHSSAVVAVSRRLEASLRQHHPEATGKMTVIHNPYPHNWQADEKSFAGSGLKVVSITRLPATYIGFLSKGADRLLEVCQRLGASQPITLALATEPGRYTSLVREAGDHIQLLENATRAAVRGLLAESHITLHTSRAESFMLTLAEVMAMANVPVAFPAGAVEELLVDGQNGFIVQTVAEMIERVRYLNGHRLQARQMAEAARQTVLSRLAPQTIAQQYLRLCQEISD